MRRIFEKERVSNCHRLFPLDLMRFGVRAVEHQKLIPWCCWPFPSWRDRCVDYKISWWEFDARVFCRVHASYETAHYSANDSNSRIQTFDVSLKRFTLWTPNLTWPNDDGWKKVFVMMHNFFSQRLAQRVSIWMLWMTQSVMSSERKPENQVQFFLR